jgi:rSAM/selenodomain-associated transferase 1
VSAGVAVFAKAPVPGYAKTRLIPRLGAEGAAALQERLVRRALANAAASGLGPVVLWCAPDAEHPVLRAAAAEAGAGLAVQAGEDLGARMLAAFEAATFEGGGPLVLIGTDCPCLAPGDLREAARLLEEGADAVIAPAEDGGYGLVAARRPWPALFKGVPWSTDMVAAETRRRARAAGLSLAEIRTVWDVDTPADHERLRLSGLGLA